MTFQEAWRQYRDACYPQGIPAEQNLECHQAFFGGILIALESASKASELPEAQAVAAFDKLWKEAHEVCQSRVQTLKDRN